jgi:hemerythrin-like domain-containing protein
MPDTLFLLRLEHGNLGRLLGLIEHQVAGADAGGPMDEPLLALACEYFSDYPDRCHHPKEDLVYQRLSEIAPDLRSDLRDLVAEHHRIHELTASFASAMRRWREDLQAPESSPREVLREFTLRYRQHMRSEDERFFPLAEQRLSRSDWDSLDFALFDRDDPLFDHAAEERFTDLRERIEALAGLGGARTCALGVADGLRGLTGIESFNASMQSSGHPYRLARFAQGGYGLERDLQLLLFIPPCSSERAAWCAYSYLRGLGWPALQEPGPG